MDESTLLSIKQFSAATGLNVSTLRYYDEIGILPPISRGEDNNYRYYRPRQVIVANFIQVLIELGIPLSTIRELADDRSPETLIELLGRQEDNLDNLFNRLRTAYSIIHTYRKNILSGMMAEEGTIRIEELPATHYIEGGEYRFTSDDETFYEPFIKFINTAGDYRINLKYPIGAYHNNMDSYLKGPGRPDRFISMDPFGDRERPAGRYLVGYKRGYYGQLGDLAERMTAYAQENKLFFHGPVYTVYLLDEISMTNPDEYLSSVSVRVSNRAKDTYRNKQVKSESLPTSVLSGQLRRTDRTYG